MIVAPEDLENAQQELENQDEIEAAEEVIAVGAAIAKGLTEVVQRNDEQYNYI